jgi:VWFA-related protein
MRFRGLGSSLMIWILSASGSFAVQEPQPQDGLRFSVQSQLIQIFLTVQEGSRRVTGLDVSKFSVTEDGQARDIDHMDSEQVPLQVALLLDTSQSMTESLKETQEAAALFVHSLKPGDRVTLIPFNSSIRTVPQLTDDFEPILTAIRNTRAANKTKLYDAALYALKLLSDKEGRKAIALFSDGEDTASTATLPVVINSASRYGYPIYAVCRGRETATQSYRRMLRQLADTNGGKAYFAEDPTHLGSAFLEVSAELRAAYVLYYYTLLTPDDRWHELIVNVANAGYRVYCRRGFFLGRGGSAPQPGELPKDLEKVRAAGGVDAAAAKESAKAALAEVTRATETPRPAVRPSADSEFTVSTTKSKASPPKQPTFKVESRMVQVPVFLESTNGKPLPLFSTNDFGVFEDGSKKQIEYFKAIVNMEDLSNAGDNGAKPVETASSQDKALWNPAESRELTLGKYYLVLDNVTTDVLTFEQVKKGAERLVRKYHNPVQPFSVYFTSGGGSPPGADIEAMVAEIRKASAGMSSAGARPFEPISDYQAYLIERGDQQARALGELLTAAQLGLKWENMLGRVEGRCMISNSEPCDISENEASITVTLRAKVAQAVTRSAYYVGQALNGLRTAVAQAATDRGDYSKTVIFVSPGLMAPKGARGNPERELQSIAIAAKQRGIKILTIDIGGSPLDRETLNLGIVRESDLQMQRPLIQSHLNESRLTSSASLDFLSKGTGSKRVKADNDIPGALSSAVSSGRALYHLAYLSQQPADGQYHQIRVTVSSRSVRVLARQGYYARPEMERVTAPAVAMSDEEVKATLQRAQEAMKNSDYAAVAKALETLKWKFQDQTDFWFNLGVAYFNLKDAVKASDALQRAWALSPDDRATGLALSRALAAAGNNDAAVQTLQTMRAQNPMDLDLIIQLGRLYEAASQPAAAYEIYRDALDLSPSLPLDFYVVLIRTSALLGRRAEAGVFVDQYRRRGGAEETIAPWTRLIVEASR